MLLAVLVLGSAALSSAGEVTIEGLVTDRSGAPITSATLSAWECSEVYDLDPQEGEFLTITRSVVDEHGRFRLTVPIRYDHGLAVVVRSTGKQPGVLWLGREDLARGTLEAHPLALRPELPSAVVTQRLAAPVRERPVRLRLLDLRRPLGGARIRATGGTGRRFTTDHTGSCVVFVPGDEEAAIEVEAHVAVELHETHRELARVRATLMLTDAAEQEVDLRPGGGWISGATNQWDLQVRLGTIHSGLEVSFESADGRYRATVRTVEGGWFELPTTASGTLLVDPLAGDGMCGNGYRPTVAPTVRVPVKAGAADLRVALHDGVILGRIVGGTGFGVAHALVVARLSTGESLQVESGQSGTFAFWNLPPGTTRVEVSEPFGRGAEDVEVVEGEQRDVTITLR